jgi:hypothetical protein
VQKLRFWMAYFGLKTAKKLPHFIGGDSRASCSTWRNIFGALAPGIGVEITGALVDDAQGYCSHARIFAFDLAEVIEITELKAKGTTSPVPT